MNFQKAVELINKSNNILITTHIKPDGDACGSMAALSETFKALGKKVKSLMLSELPDWYEFLFSEKPAVFAENIQAEQLNDFDLVIIVDTNSYSQLPKFSDFLKRNKKPVLVFDHHITNDGLGDVELIDASAAATALIIFDFLKYAGWPVTEKIATALFVAAATDTGWFQFSNTDSRVYRTCADLIEAGANPTQLHHQLYQNFSFSRFKLMTVMFNTLELHFDGRYATQHLTQADFERTAATYRDTENLIDQCRRINSIEVVALFVELKDGRIKCSLRSTGTVDVRKIAQKFDGGGHTMAAGLHLPGSLENAKKIILEEVGKQFRSLDDD